MLAVLALLSCSGSDPSTDGPTPTEPPPPGALRVGVAQARMPVPVGIGTVGYGGFGVAAQPTPFSSIYPGTTRLHDHPDFRVVAISRGEEYTQIYLRSDTVGVFQQLRRALVLELEERRGGSFDDSLIIGATHTHSGPGRVIDGGGLFDLIADKFFPEFYENLIDAMADAVEAALDDLKPGRLGFSTSYTDDGHDDRRCEDGLDYENGTLPMVAVEQEGELVALMVAYAVHGTILGIDQLTLSQDVSGGIEQAIEDRFDRPVMVQMLNSWAADMSPSNPIGEGLLAARPGSPQPDGFDQQEAVGQVVADAVEASLAALEWTDEPEMISRTVRARIDTEAIGYEPGVFDYLYGGVYCGSSEPDCTPGTTIDADLVCVPFNAEFPAPNQTLFTAGRLGPLDFVTFPGEPGTLLAEQIMADMQALGAGDVLFVGYGQDYLGYSILEDDFWEGGYEAEGALWGPRQGEYLAARAVEAWRVAMGQQAPPEQPDPIAPFDEPQYTPYAPPSPVGLGAIVQDVPATVGPLDEVVFVVAGHDPWLGAPLATLEHADGSPVLRPGGLPVTSDGQAFWLELTTDPTYADALEAPSRAFHWHFHVPVTHAVERAVPELSGSYRIRVAIPDGGGGTVEATSGTFTVSR